MWEEGEERGYGRRSGGILLRLFLAPQWALLLRLLRLSARAHWYSLLELPSLRVFGTERAVAVSDRRTTV